MFWTYIHVRTWAGGGGGDMHAKGTTDVGGLFIEFLKRMNPMNPKPSYYLNGGGVRSKPKTEAKLPF